VIIERVAAEAIRLGADALEVEYKDSYEEIFAVSGPLGFGIARFRSSSRDAVRLREECYHLAKQKHPRHMSVEGRDYELRCAIFDSFGEDAFRLTIRAVPKTRSEARARSSRRRIEEGGRVVGQHEAEEQLEDSAALPQPRAAAA
jgi:hypothetical protein